MPFGQIENLSLHHPVSMLGRPSPVSLNLLCSNLSPGGLERSVLDTVTALKSQESYYFSVKVRAYVLASRVGEYDLSGLDGTVIHLGKIKSRAHQIEIIVADLLRADQSRLFTHGIDLPELRQLWSAKIITIPVIHNASPTWTTNLKDFDHPLCCGMVAVSRAIRDELRTAGWKRPIQVLRHDLQLWYSAAEAKTQRAQTRHLHAIPAGTFLIGMVGHFKAHKAYTRAVRVLKEVLERVPKAHLMVIGSWGEKFGCSSESYLAFCALALRLGVTEHITCLGPLTEVDAYYPAFDVLLNTSLYEGVSLASMQAIRCGCPVVSSDSGGQAELVRGHGVVVPAQADPRTFAASLEKIYKRRSAERKVQTRTEPLAVPRLWPMLNHYGFDQSLRKKRGGGVLFLTDNLNHGGPQRSLMNLIAALKKHPEDYLLLLENASSSYFHTMLEKSGCRSSSLPLALDPSAQVNAICSLLRSGSFQTICLWNVDARVKLMLAKLLLNSDLRLVDSSPGPMLFDELDRNEEYAKKISIGVRSYLRRIDCFVAKYEDGLIPERYGVTARSSAVIRNGVNLHNFQRDVDAAEFGLSPSQLRHSVLTSGRIVPSKHIEFLIASIALVKKDIPDILLTIAGGFDARHMGYMRNLQSQIRELDLSENVLFLGPYPGIVECMEIFKVFFMVSVWQGCPNASLEAMACGLPIVANDDGGTKEQVVQGETGFIISKEDPSDAARAICWLLQNPAEATAMGVRGKQRVQREFSMEMMADRYAAILRRS